MSDLDRLDVLEDRFDKKFDTFAESLANLREATAAFSAGAVRIGELGHSIERLVGKVDDLIKFEGDNKVTRSKVEGLEKKFADIENLKTKLLVAAGGAAIFGGAGAHVLFQYLGK